jgi:predicted MPP superfamily phosphohydrolase
VSSSISSRPGSEIAEPLRLHERLFFRHFFDGLAVGGALSEWALVCLLLGRAPAALDLVVVVPLAVLNRLAARRLEREPATGLLAGQAGHLILAVAFGALVAAGALGVMAGAWGLVSLLGGFTAEAGVRVVTGTDWWLGPSFRPAAGALLGVVAAALGYGYAWGHRRLVVTRVVVPLPHLPPALAGLRLVHVTDLHLGPLAERAALREAIDRVLALDPDVVCVTGDVIDSPVAVLDSWMPELARLTARHGVFAILGNHDREVGADRVAEALRRWTGWRVLRDEVGTVEVGGGRLHLLGLEDRPRSQAADALPALLARVPAGEPAVLLAHRPTVFPAAAAAGVSLMLAGHTHGGQLAVPGAPRLNVARVLVTQYDAGFFERDGARLHVNRGLGTSGQRVRIGAPREITVLTLVAAVERAA